MITAFAGSKAAAGFLANVNWRWGFGSFAIILPAVTTPLYLILKLNLRKAMKQGLWEKKESGRTIPQQIWYFVVEFDSKFWNIPDLDTMSRVSNTTSQFLELSFSPAVSPFSYCPSLLRILRPRGGRPLTLLR